MEEQQKRQVVEVEKEHRLREMAGPSTGSAAEVRAASKKEYLHCNQVVEASVGSHQSYQKNSLWMLMMMIILRKLMMMR